LVKKDPGVTFKFVHNYQKEMPTAECLVRIIPVALWAYKLNNNELYEVVRLVTSFTNTNEIVIEASYLYCFSII
jgi:ADP-ribosylglycohydrolase